MIALEVARKGDYIAIGPEGEVIVGSDDIEVVERAMQKFGSGNFTFRKVGFPAVGKWHRPVASKARTSQTPS